MIRLSRVGPFLATAAAAMALLAGPAAASPTVSSQSCTPSAPGTTPVTTCPTTTTTTTTAPTTTTTPPAASAKSSATVTPSGRPSSGRPGPALGGQPPNRPGRPTGDRDCADFATQPQAQRYFESIGGSASNNADRLDENHNGVACESLSDDGDNQDAEATTTGDDGSSATTSGDQVTEVPEGSAQTGGA